jgi:sulfur-oxidizing protein SoxX
VGILVKRNLAIAAISISLALLLSLPASAAGLVKYKINNDEIAASLTGKAGDPVNGKKLTINRKKGNCLACHSMPIPEQAFHGNIGPDLKGISSRYSEGELRLRIVNPNVLNSGTIMPAFYRVDGLHRVIKKFAGKPIISAQDVEDIVAYLMTLK